MNKEFCMHCGFKNLYEVSKPRFCAGCGEPLNTSIARSEKPQRKIEIEEDEVTDIESIDIDSLRKSISFEGFSQKTTLDDLWSAPSPKDNYKRPAINSPQGEDLLKEIKRQCSPVRTSKDIDE